MLKDVMMAIEADHKEANSVELHPDDWKQMVADVRAASSAEPLKTPPPSLPPTIPADAIAGLISGLAVVLQSDVKPGSYRLVRR